MTGQPDSGWVAFSTQCPDGHPVWVWNGHEIAMRTGVIEKEWTHWRNAELPAPPQRERTQVDQAAFDAWCKSLGTFTFHGETFRVGQDDKPWHAALKW